MGYLVIYSIDSIKSAHFFSTHDEAVDFINSCNQSGDSIIVEIQETNKKDEYVGTLFSGQKLRIQIIPKQNSSVKYDLEFVKNFNRPITRRFTNKDNAIAYAHKILDDLEAYADQGEDEQCEWTLDDPERNLKAHLLLTLVILGDTRGEDDYKILGCSPNTSDTEIKSSFKKLALKHHPDMGGDAKTFAKINEAYHRIIDGNPRRASRKVEEEYPCFSVDYLFSHMNEAMESVMEKLRAEIRAKAKSLISSGVILFVIGLMVAGISSSSTKPNGTSITIFTGLIFVGIWRFLKGGYYYINPDSLIEKAKNQQKNNQ